MKINRDSILSIENKLIEGIKNNDIGFLDTILHDDLLFLTPDGQVITKQMDLASHKSGEMVVEYLIPTFEEIKIIDHIATVIVTYDTKGSMLGNPIQGQFRYIRIWKLFGENLKVIGGSCYKLN